MTKNLDTNLFILGVDIGFHLCTYKYRWLIRYVSSRHLAFSNLKIWDCIMKFSSWVERSQRLYVTHYPSTWFWVIFCNMVSYFILQKIIISVGNLMTYTAGWNVWCEWFLAGNQGNHQNFQKNYTWHENQGCFHWKTLKKNYFFLEKKIKMAG